MNLNYVFFFSYKQGELSLLWRPWLNKARGHSSPIIWNPSLWVSMSLSHYFMGNAKKSPYTSCFFLMRAQSRLCSTQSKRRLLTIWYLFSLASKTPSSACLFVFFFSFLHGLISLLLCFSNVSVNRTPEDGIYLCSSPSPLGAQVMDQEEVSHSGCFIRKLWTLRSMQRCLAETNYGSGRHQPRCFQVDPRTRCMGWDVNTAGD